MNNTKSRKNEPCIVPVFFRSGYFIKKRKDFACGGRINRVDATL
jgi:hypothetical protein